MSQTAAHSVQFAYVCWIPRLQSYMTRNESLCPCVAGTVRIAQHYLPLQSVGTTVQLVKLFACIRTSIAVTGFKCTHMYIPQTASCCGIAWPPPTGEHTHPLVLARSDLNMMLRLNSMCLSVSSCQTTSHDDMRGPVLGGVARDVSVTSV